MRWIANFLKWVRSVGTSFVFQHSSVVEFRVLQRESLSKTSTYHNKFKTECLEVRQSDFYYWLLAVRQSHVSPYTVMLIGWGMSCPQYSLSCLFSVGYTVKIKHKR